MKPPGPVNTPITAIVIPCPQAPMYLLGGPLGIRFPLTKEVALYRLQPLPLKPGPDGAGMMQFLAKKPGGAACAVRGWAIWKPPIVPSVIAVATTRPTMRWANVRLIRSNILTTPAPFVSANAPKGGR